MHVTRHFQPTEKCWGTTARIFGNGSVELHRIIGRAKGFCSKHRHVTKSNLFFVESGRLMIEIWNPDGACQSSSLGPGMACEIEPGRLHRFRVIEDDTIAFELYFAVLDPDDIIREEIGGMTG